MDFSGLAQDIATWFFDVAINLIGAFINVLFLPLNNLLQPFLDALVTEQLLINFYSVITNYVVPTCSWFINIIPPYTWSAITLYISIIIGTYTIVFALNYVLLPLRVIKKILPFT